jgi:zinc/manganese transport system permease protein
VIGDLAAFLAVPFAACAVFVGIHTYFGLHVLRRNVVFADLALAQLSALGATLAVAVGHAPGTLAGFLYALLATLAGAALLTASRAAARAVSQEAFIGILYVVATAATILVVDSAPQGAEHVKRMLVGSILAVGPAELEKIVLLYGAIALFHWAARRGFAAASAGQLAGTPAALWDFLFYAGFGAVVTSSVAAAGVLVVFSFLIIPAVIGRLFSSDMPAALAIGWGSGMLATILGFAASFGLDLPTGATLVLAFAAVLLGAGTVRALIFDRAEALGPRRRAARRGAAFIGLALLLGASLWSIASPAADQPLLAALERVGLAPAIFMSAGEAAQYREAAAGERDLRARVEALNAEERERRWRGAALTQDEVRRIASYQQSYNEMGKGERFVQDHLLARARERERWWVSLPVAALAALGLGAMARLLPLPRLPTRRLNLAADPLAPPSWPGLSRPSTPSRRGKKDVDAREKPGHDDVETSSRLRVR